MFLSVVDFFATRYYTIAAQSAEVSGFMKKIIYNIIYALLLAALLAAEVYLVYRVIHLNMLPNRYVAVLICVLLLIAGGVGMLVFMPRKRLWLSILRQFVAVALCAVTIAGCCYVSPKVEQLETTVEKITTNEPPKPARNIYVPNDDPAQTIEDAASYRFAAVEWDRSYSQQVVDELNRVFQTEIAVVYYENEFVMAAAYFNDEADAIIASDGHMAVWSEQEDEIYTNFRLENRVLYTVYVTECEETETVVVEPVPELEPVSDITNTPFVVYLSGMDGYSELLSATRSDVNILMIVNPETKQVLMINTPRDYYVVHPWGYGTRDKLTHCGIYGIECSMQAIEMLYDLPINYYAQINFNGFEKLIDAIGGITVYSENSFYGGDWENIYIGQGEISLNGEEALAFARDRKHQPGGDNGRGKNQMKVVKAVISKMTSGRTLITNYSEILNSLEGMIATNIEQENISKLVKMQLSDNAQWNVLSYAVTGYDSTKTTYSMPGMACYVMQPNQSSVDYAKELASRVMNGEILTQDDMTVPK